VVLKDRVYLKEKRERIEKGEDSVEKGGGPGGFRPNGHPLPFDQNRGGGGIDRAGRPAGVLAGGLVHGDAQEVGQNREEAEGIPAPCLTWAKGVCGGGSA
jgi:hypothetical protein